MAKKEKNAPEVEEVAAKAEATPAAEEEIIAKKEKKGFPVLLVSLIAAGVVVLGAIGFVVFGMISQTNAVNNFNQFKYEEAYNASTTAFFMDAETKLTIAESYVEKVLVKNGKYVEAADLIEKLQWLEKTDKDGNKITPEDRKAALYAVDSKLSMFKAGSVVKFGEFANADVEWVVTGVKEEGGHVVAYLITKDIVANPGGWGADNTWKNGTLKSSADMFVNTLKGAEGILTTKFATPEGEEASGKAWVPSIAEIEAMLADEALKAYVAAGPSESAKALGVKPATGEKTANYYLRDLGENNMVAGVNSKGEVKLGFNPQGSNQNAVGARFCVRVDLGAK